jgi:hypothetical protein
MQISRLDHLAQKVFNPPLDITLVFLTYSKQ